MADFTPFINGTAYSYADIVVTILGQPVAGITSVTYSDSQEITENFGAGRFPVSRGLGAIEATGSITIDRAELNALISVAPLKRLQNIAEFDITVTYLPANSTPVTDILRNCRFKTTPSGGSQGDANIVSEIELAVTHIDWSN
ncbi:Phage-like element PBSX protein XKDM [uncultured Mediterranean phage uvMED]|nr:Phage-like element PBSX protein XKDM [uncultured Mediterranean phage uvMED]BAR22577.1 Phage-like element PBSX protein XKDM [uncultured Mediterranean phage uvMED]